MSMGLNGNDDGAINNTRLAPSVMGFNVCPSLEILVRNKMPILPILGFGLPDLIHSLRTLGRMVFHDEDDRTRKDEFS